MHLPPRLAGSLMYPLQERVLGRPTFGYLHALERSQHLSRAEIEALQLDKLRALLRLAHDHAPWHRKRLEQASLHPEQLGSLVDLRRLPRMDKQDAASNHDALVWRGVPGGAFRYNTGGSSGQPLTFHFGRWRQASDAAGRMRARRWWGVQPGDPEVYLWGAPVELNKTDWVKTVRDRLINQLVLNAFAMSPQRMDGYLDAMEAFAPRCVYGYASSMALLAAHARARGRRPRLPRLKVVCTTGEPLYEHQRTLLSEVFGAPVANEFGSRDIGFTAHEAPPGASAHPAPQGALLLMSESILLEVLDETGQPVADGQLGEAVITGLCSHAQPFIRYRTGDMVRLGVVGDPGGRGLHVIDEVVGRRTDFLVRSDGTIMHALAGIYVLRATAGVAEFKLVQHTLDDLEVLVVTDARWLPQYALRISEGLQQRFGHGVRVTVRVVEQIEAEASGKHRYVVSHVRLGDALEAATSSD